MNEKTTRRVSAAPRGSSRQAFRLNPDALDGQFAGTRMLKPHEETGPPTTMKICNGRTLDAPIPGEMRVVGYDSERRVSVTAQNQRRYYPGEEITLPQSEARRLEELGFLIKPSEYKLPPTREEEEVTRVGPREQ
jgi:hypothetical protein